MMDQSHHVPVRTNYEAMRSSDLNVHNMKNPDELHYCLIGFLMSLGILEASWRRLDGPGGILEDLGSILEALGRNLKDFK